MKQRHEYKSQGCHAGAREKRPLRRSDCELSPRGCRSLRREARLERMEQMEWREQRDMLKPMEGGGKRAAGVEGGGRRGWIRR